VEEGESWYCGMARGLLTHHGKGEQEIQPVLYWFKTTGEREHNDFGPVLVIRDW